MKNSFDLALSERIGLMRGRGKISPSAIVAKLKACLLRWVDPLTLDALVESAESGKIARPELVSNALRTCHSIGALFADLASLVDYSGFVANIKQGLLDLQHADYDPAEVASFKHLQGVAARGLMENFKGDAESKAEFTVFNLNVQLNVVGFNGEWARHLYSDAVTLAVASGQLKKMPHEHVMFSGGRGLEGIRKTIPVPEDLLVEAALARKQVMEYLPEDWALCTLSEIKKILAPKHLSLKELDPHWPLMQYIIDEACEPFLINAYQEEVKELFPKDATSLVFDEVPLLLFFV